MVFWHRIHLGGHWGNIGYGGGYGAQGGEGALVAVPRAPSGVKLGVPVGHRLLPVFVCGRDHPGHSHSGRSGPGHCESSCRHATNTRREQHRHRNKPAGLPSSIEEDELSQDPGLHCSILVFQIRTS
eukprot:1155656-Pelagomonas_calceolata.AAC.4